MASIDIRTYESTPIFEITFADNYDSRNAYFISKENYGLDIESNEYEVGLRSKEDVLNLIKALNKAIELGWVE